MSALTFKEAPYFPGAQNLKSGKWTEILYVELRVILQQHTAVYGERERQTDRQGRGMKQKQETKPELELVEFVFFSLSGMFVKAVFRVRILAESTSTVSGNYNTLKCVTCPNAVSENQGAQKSGWQHTRKPALPFIHCAAPRRSTEWLPCCCWWFKM